MSVPDTATITDTSESIEGVIDDPDLIAEEGNEEEKSESSSSTGTGPAIISTVNMSRFLSTARTDNLIEITGIEYEKEDRTISHFGTAQSYG